MERSGGIDMYRIIGTNITLTRGDTLLAHVTPKQGDEEYIPQDGDHIRFAMKKSYRDTEALIVKQIPIDTCLLELEPEDTKELQMDKTYVYDIELTYADGKVDTFISGTLKLANEVL